MTTQQDHERLRACHLPEEVPSKYIITKEETTQTSPSDRMGRCSFSSIREDDSGIAQTFTTSKVSSYTVVPENAIDDSPTPTNMTAAVSRPPLTRPESKLHRFWFPPDRAAAGWKGINVKGKLASKSFGDLQALNCNCMDWEPTPAPAENAPVLAQSGNMPGSSRLEKLPQELINQILENLVLDVPPNGVDRRNVDLVALLLTSRMMYTSTLPTIYQRVTIPHSRIFRKFLAQITHQPGLGKMVRRIDFSHFNPSMSFSTASERASARNLTSETLLQCLELTPNLQEFLAQEYLDDDLTAPVLQKLFTGIKNLEAIDLCGCTKIKKALAEADIASWPERLSLKRLSLHKCINLQKDTVELLLPRLAHVTHLDLAGVKVTDKALMSIPETARLSHLNLAKSTTLTADAVIEFFSSHPAVRESSLVFLNVGMDMRTHELLDTTTLGRLLPLLPKTLQSLNIRGSKMDKSHVENLLPLMENLEELALGQGLSVDDIGAWFDEKKRGDRPPMKLKYLDMTDIEDVMPDLFSNKILLKPQSQPVEVIEVCESVAKKLGNAKVVLDKIGWRLQDLHQRAWLVRPPPPGAPKDDGRRSWKHGASYWGMRKIPVATAEVGGMYGSYMFGRHL